MTETVSVLMVANFADRVGGGEESLLGLVQSLNRRRVQPHVIVPAEGELATLLRALDVPVAVVPLPPIRPWTVLAGWVCVRRIRAVMKSWKISLVHAHGSRGALYAALSAKGRGVPVIWHVRVMGRDPWLDGMLWRLSSRVIVNSRATARRFAGRAGAGQKLQVIYNGVDLKHFAPGEPETRDRERLGWPAQCPMVLFAGRLEHGKGPDVFLDAAAHIHRAIPDACFVVAGEGPLRPALEALAQTAGVPIRFVGHQSDVLPLLRLSAAVVVPSREEGFGRILIEAMAVQKPVIASRVGGIPEVCVNGKTGLLVTPADPVALARAVVETLSNPTETRHRVKAAAESVRALFGLHEHAARTSEVYADLLKQGTAPHAAQYGVPDETRTPATVAVTMRDSR